MSKAAMIRARIEPELKTEVENIFRQLGLTATEAITLFYRQVFLHRGLPFPIRVPNPTTLQTFQDTDAGKNIVQCQNAEELFAKLDL